jgi:MFS family permease
VWFISLLFIQQVLWLIAGAPRDCCSVDIADGFLASASGLLMLFSGVAFWGLHMGLTQGLVGKLVADTAPPDLRGTCFGYFYLASGVATLASSVIAGLLWDNVGAAWTFAWGAALVAVAIIPLLQMKSSNQ